MPAPWNIRIYGSNTNYSPLSSFILKSILDADVGSGVVYQDATATWLKPEPEAVGSEIEYANGRREGLNKVRFSFSLETKSQNFPAGATTLESYYLTEPLKYRYKWLWFNDYPLRPDDGGSPVADTKCVQVAFTGVSVQHDSGIKFVTYEFTMADEI